MHKRVLDQELLTFDQAAKLFPKPLHRNTLHRWTRRGCQGVRLKSWIVGGVRVTSREAIEAFIIARTAKSPVEPPVVSADHLVADADLAQLLGEPPPDEPDATNTTS